MSDFDGNGHHYDDDDDDDDGDDEEDAEDMEAYEQSGMLEAEDSVSRHRGVRKEWHVGG